MSDLPLFTVPDVEAALECLLFVAGEPVTLPESGPRFSERRN